MTRLALLSLLLLAACGVDGAPTPPREEAVPGIRLSGTAEIGISTGGN
jgi:hypothetical protein